MCYVIGLAVPGASDLCFPRATMLRQCSREGLFRGWRCSRKGVPTGSARTPRSTLRGVRARPWSDAIFANTHAFDIRCSRSVVLQPPGRTPAMVAQGTRANFFGEGDALRPMACPTRCRSAPFVVLRAVPWRRILSYASLLCRRNGLRAWRPARLREGASCGWRRSRKGVPTGSARTPRGTLRDVRK